MEHAELVMRLKGYEWKDIEFKRALNSVPQAAYKTVSAFSNTEGGWLVFGVQEGADGPEISGVQNVDKVQNDFLSVLHSSEKLSHSVAAEASLIEDAGRTVLVFHIPEARRQDKPVYLGGDIRESYIRRGAGNERCTRTEIERLIRDAAGERHDGETVDLNPERCFDDESLRWYRKLFDDRNPNHNGSLSHLEFLRNWGLVVEVGGRPVPTRAAVLLFGAAPAFRQMLPRPVVDWQWIRSEWSEDLPEERWADRLVIEENLAKVWRVLVYSYSQRAEKPFSVDPKTLRREDRPPDYVAFREAAINVLIHQDYADHARTPVIRSFNDRTVFWNPGDSFVSTEELMEPGEREVRNPRIVAAFRRVGLSEQAGTGIRAIFGNWRQLGRVPPVVENGKAQKTFQLTLLNEELLSEEQILFQAGLGVQLNDAQAKVFALVCRYGEVTLLHLKTVTGLPAHEAASVAEQLATQKLIEPVGASGRYALAQHLKERSSWTDLPTDQVGHPPRNLVSANVELLTELSATQWKIVASCDVPRPLAEIMGELGLTHRDHFRRTHLDPLLRGGVLRMIHPDRPNHPNQAYVLTSAGAALKARRAGGGG